MSDSVNDREWMEVALREAEEAARAGEVPVGAVIVRREDGRILARAHNRREGDADPTAHAELLAIRAAAQRLGAWRLTGTVLAVTLEPCLMCAGALILARVDRLIYGADDPKAGAVRSLYQAVTDPRFNHRLEVSSGVLAAESSALLKQFFQARRP